MTGKTSNNRTCSICNIIVVVISFSMLSGCGAMNTSHLAQSLLLPKPEVQEQEIELHRERFQTDRNPESLDWLLANAIDAGMTLGEVEQILAEEGQRVYDDRWLKTNGGYYRSGDLVYKWNPDSQGRSIYLVFREDKLVNYNPEEFQDQVMSEFPD